MERIYPDHIYDPIRRQIAAELIQKELRKLLPSVGESDWPALDTDVVNWFDGKASELAEIHDFWNGFEGIMLGFKLKGVSKYLTAENVVWQKQSVNVSDIDLGWRMPPLEELGDPPYTYQRIKDWFAKDPAAYERVKQNSDNHASSSVSRDEYPIMIFKEKGKTTLLDGNRRLLRSIIYDKNEISAWVGDKIDTDLLRNFWVSTGFMRTLVHSALEADQLGNASVLEAIKTILNYLFEESSVARTNYELRVKDKFPALLD